MKVKILLAPLFIVASIFVLIWFAYPAYTNGVDGFKELRVKLDEEKSKVSALEEKSINITALYGKLQADTQNRDVVSTYIPEASKEEEILDNLNFLANDNGLLSLGISVAKPKSVSEPVAPFVEEGIEEAPVVAKITPTELDTNYSVAGNYDQIKNLLDKLFRLRRADTINSITIKRASSEENGNPNALQADMTVRFGYFKKTLAVPDINNQVFSQSDFDMDVVREIINRQSVEVLKLNVDSAGKSNPFVP